MAKEATATTGAAAAAASTTSAADAAAAKAAKAAKALRKFVSSLTYRDVSTSPPPVVLTYLFAGLFPVCRYWQTHHPYYFWCVSVEFEGVGCSLGLTCPSFSLLLPPPPDRWTVAAVIGLFTLANVVRIATQYTRRRRALKLAQSTSEKNEFGSASANKPNVLSRSANSTLTATRKVFSWREFTIALYWKTTAGELFWSVWYCAIVFLLGLIYRSSPPFPLCYHFFDPAISDLIG